MNLRCHRGLEHENSAEHRYDYIKGNDYRKIKHFIPVPFLKSEFSIKKIQVVKNVEISLLVTVKLVSNL